MTDRLDLLADLLDAARRAGATSADAVAFDATSLNVAWRLGALEKVERAETGDVGLRVFVGKRHATVSSTDDSPEVLREAAERAVAMARAAPEDAYAGLADPGQLAGDPPEIDMLDEAEAGTEALVEAVREAEDAARAVVGVTNSEGAEAACSRAAIALAATNGFARAYRTSGHSLSVSVLAGEGTAMERDYDYTTAVHREDLETPGEVGRRAGERAVRRLGARKAGSKQVPVVYDPRVSASLVRHYAAAINGAAVARGTSFLKDSLGERVLAPGVAVVDDPHRPRGLNSRPFDGEGLPCRRRLLAEDGILATWTLDLASSRQLGLEPTGNASRGVSSPPAPSVTNLYMEAGAASPEELVGGVADGFYVAELIGMGVNMVTGDYSRGASGFWIENGEIAYPVSEVTVAGNLRDMLARLTPADDLAFRHGADAPTLLVEGMTVAGT